MDGKIKFKLLVAVLLLLASLLVSCNEVNVTARMFSQSSETVYDKSTGEKSVSIGDTLDYGTWSPDLSHTNYIPWTSTNVASLADADNTLRFYFMAAEGTEVSGVGDKIGDCCLVVFPNGKTMLIDACTNRTGDDSDTNRNYKLVLVQNLTRLGITKLDYVVITHQHDDHYGCFTESGGIADSFQVGHVYLNGMSSHSGYSSITGKCNAKGITYSVLQEGDTLNPQDFGNVNIEVLNPMKNNDSHYANSTSAYHGVNNASITLRMTYGTVTALFTGDLYTAAMNELVSRYSSTGKLNVDILKIPHHGHSETSISSSFASATSPSIAVVSSGVALNENVYRSYANVGAQILDDYDYGYIILATDGSKVYTKTSRVKLTDYYDNYDN